MIEREVLAAKRPRLELRAQVLQCARAYFLEQGFLEVQTPLLTREVAPEPHIDPIPADGNGCLITSPELYMKRLLAAGYQKLFQISPAFRRGERGRRHHPEFTLLEWYRADADYDALQHDCRGLLVAVCLATGRWPGWSYQGQWLDIQQEWQCTTVREAFLEFADWDPGYDPDQTRFDLELVERVEPRLGFPQPCILKEYPAGQAALARLKADDPSVAERFELYWAGIELANGFSELIDPQEQRLRFEATIAMRRQVGASPGALPEKFLDAMANLPPCTGIAFGIDRLVMLLADADNLDQVVAFPPETGSSLVL
jgi:elongation factor P--(R)-beta-lysine ligase